MRKNVSVVTLGIVTLLSGCMGDGLDSLSTTEQKVANDPPVWINVHLEPLNPAVAGIQCARGEVMIGIHLGQRKMICAGFTFPFEIFDTLTDPPRGHTVGASPEMHGCPAGYFIQGIVQTGDDEFLNCVAIAVNGFGQTFPTELREDRDGGTASVATYGISPNMHVCPRGFAMIGIQQDDNALYCGN
jgi:hypothetical protein